MKNYYIIVNPTAGKGAGKKAVRSIESALQALQVNYDLTLTEYPGHAIKLAEEAANNGFYAVVAVGGDGTTNEVINGLVNALSTTNSASKLGVIPVGRGNDFSFGMGIPQDIESSCQLLVEGNSRPIDIGFIKGGDYPEGRYFGNGIGIGFDTIVGFEAAKLPPFISGVPGYIIAALKTIFLFFNAPTIRLEIDGTIIEQPCLLVSLMNGRRMGGSFMFAPDSETDDGLLNLCIVGDVTRMEILGLFSKVMAGTQETHPAIKMPTGKKVYIKAISGTLPVHADGETICVAGDHLEVEVVNKKLELVCSTSDD